MAALVAAVAGRLPAAMVSTAVVKDYFTGQSVVHEVLLTMDGGKLKADTTSLAGTGTKTELIYRPDLGRAWHVDHGAKTYVEIDEGLVISFSDGINTARAFVNDIVRDTFPDRARDEEPWVRRTPESRVIAGRSCTKHLVLRETEPFQEVWVTSWQEAGISGADYSVIRRFAQTYDRAMSSTRVLPALQEVEHIPLEGVARIDGPPVLIRHFENGRLMYEIVVDRWTQAPGPPPSFDVPAGYRKKAF